MRSIDRHLDIYRQRQAAMDLAQRRQLLGELRYSHPARHITGNPGMLKFSGHPVRPVRWLMIDCGAPSVVATY